MRAGDVFLTTIADLTWALQNNLAGWFGMHWTINFWFSLIKRLGDRHALREFWSGEGLAAKYVGTWGWRKGGLLSPRGRVWTFQHLVWSSSYDFDELRTAHVFVPKEADPARVARPTLYGTMLLAEPLGTVGGSKISIDPAVQNLPITLQGSALVSEGLRGWTRYGGRAEAVYPGSLVPHFPAGGLHFDAPVDRLVDANWRYGAQLKSKVVAGGDTMDLEAPSALTGMVSPGDRFTVEGDDQTYVVANQVLPVAIPPGTLKNQVPGVKFTPPSKKDWSSGVDVEFATPFTTPAPQDCKVTELEPDGTIHVGKIERETLITADQSGLGVAAKDLFYLVDTQGVGQIAEVVTAVDGPGSTRVRMRGDDAATIGRATVKVRGVAATPAAEAAGVALTRADDQKLGGLPAPAPDYAVGDVLKLTLPSGKLVTMVTALQSELVLDEALPKLASAGSVALLDVIASEADRPAKLGADGKAIDFKVGADPVANLPASGAMLLVTGTAAGAARIPAFVTDVVDDHQVKLDRSVGTAGDAVAVRTLTKKNDLGKDPKATGTTLTYTPAKAGTAPSAASFVLADAGEKAVRRVQSVTFDGVLIDQKLTAAAAPAPVNALRFPTRASKLNGDKQPAAPTWVLTGTPRIGNATKAVALRVFATLPVPPAASGANLLPGGTTIAANVVQVATMPGTLGALNKVTPGALVRAVATNDRLAVVKRVQLDLTLDRALPAGAGAANLELVPLDAAGPEYRANARDKLLITVQPEVVPVAATQVEMPRFIGGELIRVSDGTTTSTYRVKAVEGATLTLEAGPDLTGFPKAITVRRLAAADPGTGGTRAGLAGSIPVAADRTKLRFDVWTADAIAAARNVAIVDAGQTWPAAITSVDAMRVELTPDGALTDGPVTLEVPAPTHLAWSAAFTRDGDDLVLEDAVVAVAGAVTAPLDVVALPYGPTPRSLDGRLSSGTVKVPDRLDDQYDLDRVDALTEHELHHTIQSEELGPLLLSLLPMWAIEIIGERSTGADRTKFNDTWSIYSSIVESLSVGGVLDYAVGATWGSVIFGALCLFHGINKLLSKSDRNIDFLDPFALTYVDATSVAGQPKQIQCALQVAVGDRLRFKKPSDDQPFGFFSNMRTVTKVIDGGVVELDSADPLPVEGGKTSVAKMPGTETDPLRSADNALLRGYGLGWMNAILDPWGDIDFRVSPAAKGFGGVLARIARYAFGTRSWGLVLFSGVAFWDNLRRQWGLTKLGPNVAGMEQGSSYFSGDTYYPLALLRASGDEAKTLDDNKLFVGDIAQSWFVQAGGQRATGSVLLPGQRAAPGVPAQRALCQMPFAIAPATPPTGLSFFGANLGWQIDPAVGQSALAVPDALVDKDATQPLEPKVTTFASGMTERRQFLPSARGTIPVSQELERAAGAYVAFCKPTDPTHAKHRVTLVDLVPAGPGLGTFNQVSGVKEAREAFDQGVGIFSRHLVELVHDLEVRDVEVRLGGRLVAENVEVALLPFERARIEVTPNGSRRYDVTVTRPTDGNIQRIAGDLSLRAGKTAAAEPAEASRLYRYVGGKGFDGGGLASHGMHVPTDVHVPVRRFKVKVDTVLPVHGELDPDKVKTDAFKPGERAHLLVPVRLRPTRPAKFNPTVAVKFDPPAPGIDEPVLVADPGLVDPSTVDKLKTMFAFGGRVLTVALDPNDPPEQDIQVDVSVDVGPDDANTATCTATFKASPFFTLTSADGKYSVPHGAKVTITLDCSGGVQAGQATATPAAGITLKSVAGAVTVEIAADAPVGKVRILVPDGSNSSHKASRTITIT